MKSAKLTKRVRYAKVGDVIVVPLGMYFPHAVQVERVYNGELNQIVASGVTVERDGCSNWRIGEHVEVCIGFYS